MEINYKELLQRAHRARNSSYAPYSHFCVGAALLTADGEIFEGCNIENASFTPTVCAERVAMFKAISSDKRSFVAVAVVGGKEGEECEECFPCGVCRQVLAEFCGPDFIIVTQDADKINVTPLSTLLPHTFNLLEK